MPMLMPMSTPMFVGARRQATLGPLLYQWTRCAERRVDELPLTLTLAPTLTLAVP